MIYEVRTLEINSKLYRANGYSTIDMKTILKHQKNNPPELKNQDWAYSLYFSNDPYVCGAYILDCKPNAYLIEITLKKPIKYIFTDDPFFATSGLSKEDCDKYMKCHVIPNTSKAIFEHTKDENLSQFHYPSAPFMQELGNKHFAFSDIMVNEIEEDEKTNTQYEIIIPHSLLKVNVFDQKTLKYEMNEKMNGFKWVEK